MCERISERYECVLPNGKEGIREEVSYLFCDDLWRYIKEFAIDYDILALDEIARKNLNERISDPRLTASKRSLFIEVHKWMGRQMRQNKQCKVCSHCNKKTSLMYCNTEIKTGKVWCDLCIKDCIEFYAFLINFHHDGADWHDVIHDCLADIPDLYKKTGNCETETEDD